MTDMERNERLANDIRDWLIKNDMWIDVRIYFNGIAYCTGDGFFSHYNDPEHFVIMEDADPRKYFKYVNPDHILSMSFEGELNHLLNGYIPEPYCTRLYNQFSAIFEKYGVCFHLGNSWNLTCYECEK